jgi:hypothetical protein
VVTQSQASKIRRALIKTDRLSERQNQGNLVTQSHGSKVTAGIVTRIARPPKSFCRDNDYFLVVPAFLLGMTIRFSLNRYLIQLN